MCMSDTAMLWMIAGYTLFVALIFFAMAQLGVRKSENPTMILGVRTAATTRSPEHWFQAHRAARRYHLMGAVTVALCIPLMLTVGLTADPGLGFRLGGLAVGVSAVTFLVLAVTVAVRAARRVDADRSEPSVG